MCSLGTANAETDTLFIAMPTSGSSLCWLNRIYPSTKNALGWQVSVQSSPRAVSMNSGKLSRTSYLLQETSRLRLRQSHGASWPQGNGEGA